MKKVLFGLLLIISCTTFGQVQFGSNKAITATGNLTGAAQTVSLALNAESGATVEITGTWVGTITFEGTLGGVTFNPINAVSSSTSSPQANTTVNGLYRLTPASLATIRVNMTAYTSGTANILIRASTGTGGIFANQIIPVKSNETIAVNALHNTLALPIRQVPQREFRSTFSAVRGSFNPLYWNTIITGSGQTATQANGNGIITTGTTINSETIIRSNEEFKGAMTMKAKVILSQRIVNQNFFVEMVDVIGDGLAITITSATAVTVTYPTGSGFSSENVGQATYLGAYVGTGTFVPGRYLISAVSGNNVTYTVAGFAAGNGTCSVYGWNYHQILYNGTNINSNTYDAQREGRNSGVTTPTINNTAVGHLNILNVENGISMYADQLTASSTVKAITERASRVENMPGSNVNLFLQIRAVNGSTAPVSTTTYTIGFASVEDYVPVQTSVVSNRAQSPQAGSWVNVGNNATVNATGTVSVSTVSTLNGGPTANSTASISNPSQVGGVIVPTTAATQNQTFVANDVTRLPISTGEQVIIKQFSTSEMDWTFASSAPVNNTTDVVVKVASGTAGIRTYITGLQIINSSATTSTEVVIKDGATVIWRGFVGTSALLNSVVGLVLPTPLKTTANTALNFACITTGANVYVNVQGYTGF